ncbi:hypothetical protein [Methanothermococcus sp.]|uniref:hypothetical protein n=1 Tax=Methanothermococcus sp. TaxID=2614238 RepID=UPI0025CE247E|nr:hypothetical protein [Methanothermococcus sp.]
MVLNTLKLLLRGYKSWTPDKYHKYAYGQWYEDMFYLYINYTYIVFDNVKVKGSFYCTRNWCEIRGKNKNMILPIKNVEFYKKTTIVETTEFDNNHISKGTIENHILLVVKKYSLEDIKRWKRWKRKI